MSDAGAASPTYLLSQLRLAEQALPEVLARVVDIVRNATDGCDEAGLALGDPAVAPASTGAMAAALDLGQREIDEGPCAASLRSGTVEEFEATTHDPRWPRFTTLARQNDLSACLAVPLVTGPHTIGVLNLYTRMAGGFGRLGRQAATIVAEQAAILVANAQAYAAVLSRTDQLRRLLTGPEDLVAQATGVLMARHELGLQTARTRLEDQTRHGSRSLEDTARRIVDSIG